MGYDVGAHILQGWKLNDFFEAYCEDDLTFIYNVFEEYMENDDEKDWLPHEDQEKVGVERPDYEKEAHYIGMYPGGGVSNRGGPTESTFELKDLAVVAETIIRVMRKPNHPLFNMIADMMEDKPIKNYLLLSESY